MNSVIEKYLKWRYRKQDTALSTCHYEMFFKRVLAGAKQEWGCFALFGSVFILSYGFFWLGQNFFIIFASVSGAALLYFLIGTIFGAREYDKIALLPFFEKPVGEIDTFLAGNTLAWNSKRLDQVARNLALPPLCDFASGDPIYTDEESRLFEPSQAIPTIVALRQNEEVLAMGSELSHDMAVLYDALKKADSQGIRFSIHLRIGSTASFHEMETRGGSYF